MSAQPLNDEQKRLKALFAEIKKGQLCFLGTLLLIVPADAPALGA